LYKTATLGRNIGRQAAFRKRLFAQRDRLNDRSRDFLFQNPLSREPKPLAPDPEGEARVRAFFAHMWLNVSEA
jgi:hypothetical protein